MNARQLLRDLHRECRDAINQQPERVSISALAPTVRLRVRGYQAASKMARANARWLTRYGIYANNIQRHTVVVVYPDRVKRQRERLAVALRVAELGLLKATTPQQRAAAIEQFIADTQTPKRTRR